MWGLNPQQLCYQLDSSSCFGDLEVMALNQNVRVQAMIIILGSFYPSAFRFPLTITFSLALKNLKNVHVQNAVLLEKFGKIIPILDKCQLLQNGVVVKRGADVKEVVYSSELETQKMFPRSFVCIYCIVIYCILTTMQLHLRFLNKLHQQQLQTNIRNHFLNSIHIFCHNKKSVMFWERRMVVCLHKVLP